MSVYLPDFQHARVLVAGDVMLDHYCYGETSRISPEAPVPVVRVQGTEKRPGGAANVAMNVAALGAQVTLLGVVGADEAAQVLCTRLEQAGIVCALEHAPDFETITKMRIISRNQQLIRLDMESPVSPGAAQAMNHRLGPLLNACAVLVLSDYGKGTLVQCQTLIAAARNAGCKILVDPKGTNFNVYCGATLATPNQSEFEGVVGYCVDTGMLAEKGENLRQELQLEALLITRGEHGMCLLQAQHPALHLSARTHEVFDVTGAGDTVIGVLAAALAAGQDLADAARLANVAAGLVVEKLGAATTSVTELHQAIAQHPVVMTGMLDEAQLQAQLIAARARGERIVMTNGCFDLLHAGHVHYLEQAARLGDRLLVAVNDDDSVRRLKGIDRPLNSVAARMQVLAALGMVDWVVAFGEDTPEKLIARILPEVLVKGGDYKASEVAGAEAVCAAGGQVEILDYLPGYSSSDILFRARGECA